jgi:hypothetical protein
MRALARAIDAPMERFVVANMLWPALALPDTSSARSESGPKARAATAAEAAKAGVLVVVTVPLKN